jgi:phosphoadenosine phosphosulfate reductase
VILSSFGYGTGVALLPSPDLTRHNESFEGAHPAEVVAWAADRFGDGLVFTASFEDPVLVHVVATAAPGTPIVLLDTQYLFAETLWYAEHLRQRLGFPLEVVRPLGSVIPDDRWQTDVEGCCGVRKVEPLERALRGRRAWITGIRRVDGPTRADAPILSWDAKREVVKLNPLAAFSDDDLTLYAQLHDLPPNPLAERGYPSIGCWPCTRPVAPGEDRRAGRWSGHAKTECGLHT